VTIGSSIFMLVVGAILRYAITVRVHGVNLRALGLILAIAGIVTLVLRLIWLFNPTLGERAEAGRTDLDGWPAGPAPRRPPTAPAHTGPDDWGQSRYPQ
jgi:Domain of unknown function (DUF6458)